MALSAIVLTAVIATRFSCPGLTTNPWKFIQNYLKIILIILIGAITFSNNEGNLVGELTRARKPSKSSLTVLGEAISEWASIIRVNPLFFPK